MAYLWKQFGLAVGLNPGTLNTIQANNGNLPDGQKACLGEVFIKWQQQVTSPYKWRTVAEALKSIYQQNELNELYDKLITRK